MPERLTVCYGPMFSGKTGRLIHELTVAREIGLRRVQAFKPAIDDRWQKTEHLRSHDGDEFGGTIPIREAAEILEHLRDDTEVVGIDEVQFLDDAIIGVVDRMLARNIEVICAGLPLDFKGEPFGPTPQLIAKADTAIKLTAHCNFRQNGAPCRISATKTQRIIDGKPASYYDPVIVVGEKELYEARCHVHHQVPDKPNGAA